MQHKMTNAYRLAWFIELNPFYSENDQKLAPRQSSLNIDTNDVILV